MKVRISGVEKRSDLPEIGSPLIMITHHLADDEIELSFQPTRLYYARNLIADPLNSFEWACRLWWRDIKGVIFGAPKRPYPETLGEAMGVTEWEWPWPFRKLDPYNPRVDLVIINGKKKRVLRGKPTPGANMNNLLGAPRVGPRREKKGWRMSGFVFVPQRKSR